MEESTPVVTRAERILVALDGSVPSRHALQNAISLAKKCQGKIFLVRILEMSAQGEAGSEGRNRLVQDMQKTLQQVEQEVAGQGLECESVVHMGPQIAPLIVQEARDRNIDLIAMGTHGWTGQTAIAAMGSVARKVLCTAPCPVLIIPPRVVDESHACQKK